ncbi:hypothetical protein [Streptomyces sp. NPDC059063]|uniref:hypothetical protein n=1 Tax=Streptomyces sp. NPDC059063 TaxID=3346712 RepID=UPI0036A169A1
MCDTADDDKPAREEPPTVHVAPPGHSRAGHRVHGWCSRCPGREVWEELLAWRLRENESADESPAPDRAPAPSREATRG